VGLVAIWWILEYFEKHILNSLFFLMVIMLSLLGSLTGSPYLLALIGCLSALIAWDLSRFTERMEKFPNTESRASLEKIHLNRLLITAGAGFLCSLLAGGIQATISFITIFALALIGAISIAISVATMKKQDEQARKTLD